MVRTSGEQCTERESINVFAVEGGSGGSLAPIAISILVKNPNATATWSNPFS